MKPEGHQFAISMKQIRTGLVEVTRMVPGNWNALKMVIATMTVIITIIDSAYIMLPTWQALF